jgi:anaerobic selenocysteine-containing dehydrogenase
MGKQFTRRNLLKFVGGSAAGVLLTPIPWKMLDDVAIWTQNWSWIPRPLKGEIQTRFTTCTLCPAGCGVRARCVASQPVSLSGVAAHPVSRGAICPVGIGGHHLPYHPARLLQPVRMSRENGNERPVPISLDAAIDAIARVAEETRASGLKQTVAVLDQRPGRTMSLLYRRFVGGLKSGIYLTSPSAEGRGFDTLQRMLLDPWGHPGFDIENTATLLSFGAPILDGWGAPGRVAEIADARAGGSGGRRLKLIQVEPRRSRTAAAADLWIPIRPGTETALALGLAHVLIQEKLYDEKTVREQAIDFESGEGSSYLSLVGKFTPDAVSRITGVSAERIAEIARELAQRSPAVAVGGGDPGGGPLGEEEERAIWGLNFLLGSVGKTGGVVARRDVPEDPALIGDGLAAITRIEDVPDRSIRLLIMDPAGSGSAVPWKLLEKKLVQQTALVVSLTPVLAGDARRANLVIPTPAYMEALEEASTPIDSGVSTFSISQPLLPVPAGVTEPPQFIQRLAAALSLSITSGGESCTLADCLKRRAEVIHKSGRGSVFTPQDGKSAGIAGIDSPDKFWKLLNDGACWVDAGPDPAPLPRCSLIGKEKDSFSAMARAGEGRLPSEQGSESEYPVILMPYGLRAATDDTQVSPLMTKLYQESGLRRLQNQADINPETAGTLGLTNRRGALIETPSGSLRVEVRFDPGVMPGVIHVAVGPAGALKGRDGLRDRQSVLTICQTDSGSVWRVARARVREA